MEVNTLLCSTEGWRQVEGKAGLRLTVAEALANGKGERVSREAEEGEVGRDRGGREGEPAVKTQRTQPVKGAWVPQPPQLLLLKVCYPVDAF